MTWAKKKKSRRLIELQPARLLKHQREEIKGEDSLERVKSLNISASSCTLLSFFFLSSSFFSLYLIETSRFS